MVPLASLVFQGREVNAALPTEEFLEQWKHSAEVFAVLIVGADGAWRSLGQIVGGSIGPPSFSFGRASNLILLLVNLILLALGWVS